MRRLLLIATLLIIVGSYACKKSNNRTPNIVGRYKFEKVVVRDGIINVKNVTQDYNNMILLLDDQGRAELVDQNKSIHYYGTYEHNEDVRTYYWSDDDDGSYNTVNNSTLFIDVTDTSSRKHILFQGKDLYRTNKKLRFTVPKADGDYRYKLAKF